MKERGKEKGRMRKKERGRGRKRGRRKKEGERVREREKHYISCKTLFGHSGLKFCHSPFQNRLR
jgi:hypothetical protein